MSDMRCEPPEFSACPLCGGDTFGTVVGIFHRVRARCSRCDTMGPVRDTFPEAAAAWNVRPTPAEVEALQHEIHDLRHDLNDAKDVDRENATLRARVETLERALTDAAEALRRLDTDRRIDLADADLWGFVTAARVIARAALSADKP